MILEQSSIENRKYFLIEFTKKLISASRKQDFFELKTFVQKENKAREDRIEHPLTNESFTKKIEEKVGAFSELKKIEENIPSSIPKFFPTPRLNIPDYPLPPTVSHLKPSFSVIADIDLGKINPLIKDPMVREIQCNGSGKRIIVRGAMGEKPSSIILESEEIDLILDVFSKTAKIPISEGVTKIVIGNLILSAITSEVLDTKFIIKKMFPEPAGRRTVYGR